MIKIKLIKNEDIMLTGDFLLLCPILMVRTQMWVFIYISG